MREHVSLEQLSPDEERDLILQLPVNPDGFRRLYRHYSPRVFNYVVYRVGSKQDAEDLTADIFLKIIEALDRFEYRGAGSFATWVFRIAHNTVQQFYRHTLRRELVDLDDLPEIQSHELLPEEVIARKEQVAYLHSVLTTLTPRRQEIITLRFFGGLHNHEIAAVLNLDERTVASHLCRGLEDLTHKFQAAEVIGDSGK
jgi:RNA polymerase sigma-70 factor (ECF subfamily)